MAGQQLDEFSIKFDAEGLKELNNDLKNETSQNLDKTEEKFKRVEVQSTKLMQNFKKLTVALGALAFAGKILRSAFDTYEAAEKIDTLAKKTNIAVDSLQRLGIAASKFGGNTESTATSIQKLKITGNAEQELENIASKMEKMKTDAQKMEFAKSLGIDEGTTRLLIQGVARYREELKRANKYKLYTKEDIERIRDYRQAQADIRMGIESIYKSIASMLLPALVKISSMIRKVTDWLAAHEGAAKIIGVFVLVVAGITAVNTALSLLLANPVVLTIVAIAAAITALIAIINDLIVFIQGGESVIGDILEKMGYDTEAIRADVIREINAIISFIKTLIGWVQSVGQAFIQMGAKIREWYENLPEPIKKILGGVKNAIDFSARNFNVWGRASQTLEKYKKTPANAVPAGAVQNYNTTKSINENTTNNAQNISTNTNNKTTNIGTINIQTQATNGAEVADSINQVSQDDNGLVA